MSEDNSLVVPARSSMTVAATLSAFEDALLSKAEEMGLPATGVVHEIENRVTVLQNMDSAMGRLSRERRADAIYLSKFMMAISAGLFDAALNYLWDETISELRKRIVDYDLAYFFDLAVDSPEKRKDLKEAEDLSKITDDELIRAATRVGFISDLGHRQLDLVRQMRNHASAAHPNQHELKPFSLLGYMETCISEVIMLPQSPTMVETSRLLRNIKSETLTAEDASGFDALFHGLRGDQTSTLARGLFGIYVAPDSTPTARDNIRLLLPRLWPTLSEEVKSNFGVRFARFKANLETGQAELAREFLSSVGGESYLPADVRSGEIDAILDRLRSTHEAFNNFYNEPPVARELADYIGSQALPEGVLDKYIEVLVTVFIGWGSGISWSADPIYRELLSDLTPEAAEMALYYATGVELSTRLERKSPQTQLNELLDLLRPKVISRPGHALLSAVEGFTGPKDSMYKDTGIKKLREALAISR